LVLGRDFSGAVAALGAGVDDLKNVDAVFGVLEVGREGAYAEKLAVRRAPFASRARLMRRAPAGPGALIW